MKKVLLCLALICLTVAPAMATSTLYIGNPPDPGAGNCFPFGCVYNAEYQQIYDQDDFPGPIQITDLYLYNTQVNNNATQTPAGTYTISLSTSPFNINNVSATFAQNIGPDNTTVFTGSINQNWQFGNTLSIHFDTPFNYDPTIGTLLIDVVGLNITQPSLPIFFDVNSTGGYFSRVYCPGGSACQTGTVQVGYGFVTGLGYQPIPEPGTLFMLGTGLIGAVGAIRRRIM